MSSYLWNQFVEHLLQSDSHWPNEFTYIDLGENILGIEKWGWDYERTLKFQLLAQQFVKKNPHYKIFIFCNHPPLYTIGRGLQKHKGQVAVGLQEMSNDLLCKLKFPIHKIHRGGGLTFHHPGQWIFYPITALTPSWGLSRHFDWILKSTTDLLKQLFNLPVEAKRDTAGIWIGKQKIASVGIGVDHLITSHGLALNLLPHFEMKQDMQSIHPCGLPPTLYSSIWEQVSPSEHYVEKEEIISLFHRHYLSHLLP